MNKILGLAWKVNAKLSDLKCKFTLICFYTALFKYLVLLTSWKNIIKF